MISIDIVRTGAGNVTPPAVGLRTSRPADQVVLGATSAAPSQGTGLPAVGAPPVARLRGLVAAGTTTGAFLGATVPPSVQTPALREFAVAGVPTGHTSSTPGDLPPEDPLS